MINFNKIIFIKSAPTLEEKPEKNLNEVLFVGRSNVGKSSLLNALTHSSMAFVSSKPGHTKLLNYYLIDEKFYLVDAPGYGFTQNGNKFDSSFGKMMETYFDNKNLKCIVFLLDSRIIPTNDDVDFYNFLKEKGINYILIATKCDKLNQKERAAIKRNFKSKLENIDFERVICASIKDNSSLNQIKSRLSSLL